MISRGCGDDLLPPLPDPSAERCILEGMRAFVAVGLPEEIRKRLGRVISRLSGSGAGIRWVRPERLHVTLKFLGEIDDQQERVLRDDLAEMAKRFSPFHLECAGLGVFPRPERPRVCWAGCRGETDRLAALAAAVETSAVRAGVPSESRPFRAHVTIGRVPSQGGRRGRGNPGPVSVSLPKEEESYGEWCVKRFLLVMSLLTPEGPVYEPLASFEMGRPARKVDGPDFL